MPVEDRERTVRLPHVRWYDLASQSVVGCLRKSYNLVVVLLLFAAPSRARPAIESQEPQTTPAPRPPGDQGKRQVYEFRTTTRLVILDIVATSAAGRIVSDLRPEEVHIFENGIEQTQHDFGFISADVEHPAERIRFHLPPNVFTNAPQYQGNSSFNIILLDALNTHFSNLAYAHDQLIKYLDDTPPNQPTAIYALGNKLWMLHDFTTDHQALKEAILKFKGQGSQMVIASPDNVGAYQRKTRFGVLGADRALTTLEAFRSLSRIMAAYPGRKNLIWISESFVVDAMPDIQSFRGPLFLGDHSLQLEQTSDAMMEAQIAIYPIDAGALPGDPFRPMLADFDAKSSLEQMAQKTGGKAFINRNDLDLGIRSSIDDGSSYYTTSYYPVNKTWDGKLRRIEVKTTRPGVHLRYRQGYYATDIAFGPQSKRVVKETSIDFAQALDPDLPVSTGLLFQAQILTPSDATHKVVVNFAVDFHFIAFKNSDDGLQHARVSCLAWAFPVKGKPIASGGGTVNAALDAPTFKKLMQSALPCEQALDLEPGNYMLRLGVIDQESKRIGALTAWVTVPQLGPPAKP